MLHVIGSGTVPEAEAGGAAAGKKLSRKERLRQSKARKSAAAQNNSDEEDTTTAGAPHNLVIYLSSNFFGVSDFRNRLENWALMVQQFI